MGYNSIYNWIRGPPDVSFQTTQRRLLSPWTLSQGLEGWKVGRKGTSPRPRLPPRNSRPY